MFPFIDNHMTREGLSDDYKDSDNPERKECQLCYCLAEINSDWCRGHNDEFKRFSKHEKLISESKK